MSYTTSTCPDSLCKFRNSLGYCKLTACVQHGETTPQPTLAIAHCGACDELEAGQKWVSVKDRLPDAAGVEVLVSATSQYGQQHVFPAFMGYGDFKWYTMDWTKWDDTKSTNNEVGSEWIITHWREMPEPPKEEP